MADADLPRYDRDFLLSPAKRNQIIQLWEVEKFGRDSFGDPDAVSLYGMTPNQWHARTQNSLAYGSAGNARVPPDAHRRGASVLPLAALARNSDNRGRRALLPAHASQSPERHGLAVMWTIEDASPCGTPRRRETQSQ